MTISTFQPYNAPGPDIIYPVLLQKLGANPTQLVRKLFVASLRYTYIPEEWKLVRVVFIAKPGKDNYEKTKSFRPISLVSFLFKNIGDIDR